MSLITITDNVAKAVHDIPPGFWQALLASGILSPAIKAWQHFRFTKKEKEIADAALWTIGVLAAFCVAVFQYLHTVRPNDPRIVALHTAVIGFVMTPTYLLGVKPAYKWLTKNSSAADELNNELKSAAIPVGGLPIGGTSISATADTNQADGF